MATTEFEGKKYTLSKDGDKIVLTPVDEGSKMFKFGPNGEGWYVGCAGGLNSSGSRLACKEIEWFGNCFPDEQTALKASDMMRVQNLYISAALAVDSEAGPKTEDRQWSTYYGEQMQKIIISGNVMGCQCYFKTQTDAEKHKALLDSIGWPYNLEPMP